MKMMNLARFTLAAAGFLALGVVVPAQAEDVSSIDTFEHVDHDASNCVDWDELRNAGAEFFHEMDLNGDGLIAADELFPDQAEAAGKAEIAPIDPAAFQVQLRMSFEGADADKNGCLDSKEYAGI